jgi:hypothetical protein
VGLRNGSRQKLTPVPDASVAHSRSSTAYTLSVVHSSLNQSASMRRASQRRPRCSSSRCTARLPCRAEGDHREARQHGHPDDRAGEVQRRDDRAPRLSFRKAPDQQTPETDKKVAQRDESTTASDETQQRTTRVHGCDRHRVETQALATAWRRSTNAWNEKQPSAPRCRVAISANRTAWLEQHMTDGVQNGVQSEGK